MKHKFITLITNRKEESVFILLQPNTGFKLVFEFIHNNRGKTKVFAEIQDQIFLPANVGGYLNLIEQVEDCVRDQCDNHLILDVELFFNKLRKAIEKDRNE